MAGVDWQGLYERVRHAIVTSSDAPVADADEVIVHQAIGMTMEYLGCPGLLALEDLGVRSDQTGQTLLAVAIDVVQRRFRPA
ncbi:MAG: hypothetical protein QOD72_3601 [Acidimicrobiaceae bacterium]|nr:hypothetical protein [Acidimicrobiaceae bacterium]